MKWKINEKNYVSIPHRYGTTKKLDGDVLESRMAKYVSIPHRYGTTREENC